MALLLMLNVVTVQAQAVKSDIIKFPKVYQDSNVVFYKVNNHLWIGQGHLAFRESIYLITGSKKAVLIDCGMHMPHLDKIIKRFTNKPITLLATHVHPDHVGAVEYFPEIWINPADTVNIPQFMSNYKGKVRFLKNGQKFKLGGRVIETFFTPGHTPGSTTYIDQKDKVGYSGDSFGNGNLLLTMGFSTLIKTCESTYKMMMKKNIKFFYNGHYYVYNAETPQRMKDLIAISKSVLSGKLKGIPTPINDLGLDKFVKEYGVRIVFNDSQIK